MKKKIIVSIVVIILIIIAIIGYVVYQDLKQEELLEQEVISTLELLEQVPFDIDALNKKVSTTVTTGDYHKVEKSVKEYVSDTVNNLDDLYNTLSDENITKILTPENYKEDGPDFVKTTLYISNTKNSLEEGKNKYLENVQEDKIMSYIEDKELDSYYIDLYRNLTIGDGILKTESETKEVENAINENIRILDVENEVIEFLKSNKGNWSIVDNQIAFTTEELGNQYNELLLKLQ